MSQSLSQIWIHLTFSTKGRMPFFSDFLIRDRMHKYLAKTCNNLECPAKIVGGYTDHVHILCALSKTITPSDLVRKIKSSSSKWIKQLDSNDQKYKEFQWQTGYCVFSVSHSCVDRIYSYIQKQELHHKKRNFQEELLQFLHLNNVIYDEKYLWES